MILKRAQFVTSRNAFTEFPGQGRPEVALAGKSNVGKSSLINALCGNNKLARTSGEPGKTRLINIYSIGEEFLLVDLPGYGFARAPIEEKKKWAGMIEGYLSTSKNIAHVLQLVDIRHAPTADDQLMVDYLRHYNLPFSVVATKADKLSKAERARSVLVICRTLAVQPWEVTVFSAQSDIGREALVELLLNRTSP